MALCACESLPVILAYFAGPSSLGEAVPMKCCGHPEWSCRNQWGPLLAQPAASSSCPSPEAAACEKDVCVQLWGSLCNAVQGPDGFQMCCGHSASVRAVGNYVGCEAVLNLCHLTLLA